MITFQTIGVEEDCKKLWDKYSAKEFLWDLWEFRHCFHNSNFEFNFLLGFKDGKEIGVLPLVFDTKEKIYTYFGDTLPERNKFLLKDKDDLYYFLYECPYYTTIYYIDSKEAKYYDEFEPGEKRYFLNLKKHGYDFENYLKTFTKKHRKNLKYDLKKLGEKGFDIVKNDVKDFDKLIEFNKQRFGKESNYRNKDFVLNMKEAVNTAKKMKILDMISIKIDDNAEAVGFGVFYNRCYYVLGTGRNVEIKNLGKLLIAEQIKSAISLGCDEIDFLSTESNWKELWNLDSEQTYEFYS